MKLLLKSSRGLTYNEFGHRFPDIMKYVGFEVSWRAMSHMRFIHEEIE